MSHLWTNPNTITLEAGFPSNQSLLVEEAVYTISFDLESKSGTSELQLYFEDKSRLNQHIIATKEKQSYSFDFSTYGSYRFYFYAVNNETDITVSNIKLIKKGQVEDSGISSTSHKGSRLMLESAPQPTDRNTTSFLAHYGVGTTESLYGIEPITSIVTPRYDGKFGWAIAIEDATTNLVSNGDLLSYYESTMGWDRELNGNLALSYWGSGYNSGVTNPTVGYHAHLNITRFGYPVMEFIDMNSKFGLKHRWLGMAETITTNPSSLGWSANTKVSVSFDMMTDNPKKIIQTGIYRQLADNTYTFDNTLFNHRTSTPYVWERKTITYTLGNNWDTTKSAMLYFYGNQGDNDYEGIGWVKNIQLETKDFATSFVNGSRPKGQLSYPADCINPSEGTISFWYKPHHSPSTSYPQMESPMIFQVGNYYGNSSFSLWNYTGTLALYVKGHSSTGWTATTSTNLHTLSQNKWSMLTVTWKDRIFKVYVDGVILRTATSTEYLGSIGGNIMYVGGSGGGDGSGKVCNSTIDELRIDKVERTAEEIEAWYLSNVPFLPKGTYGIAY